MRYLIRFLPMADEVLALNAWSFYGAIVSRPVVSCCVPDAEGFYLYDGGEELYDKKR
jgi:hypothetical protein